MKTTIMAIRNSAMLKGQGLGKGGIKSMRVNTGLGGLKVHTFLFQVERTKKIAY